MRLRVLKVGCFGGGTGLPSLLGGLKRNPWVDLHAIVTMFDSGGSSGQLRDELGVLPPGDVLRCALALARNEREARRILLTRLTMLENGRLAGHTGGNLLLSMMEQYTHGDFLAAVDGLRALLGCRGRVWPITGQQSTICAEYQDGFVSRGEVEVDAGQAGGRPIRRLWLEPPVQIHPSAASAIRSLDAVVVGPGSFFTSLLPIFLVQGCREALADVRGPIVYVANLLTEGQGMATFTAGQAMSQLADAIGRPIDVVIFNNATPADANVLAQYAREHKTPLPLGELPATCRLIEGAFWRRAIARHDRRRLHAAVWVALADLLLA
ncbi:MAG: YvcK family protein [Acidobacteria bacterium]|nr:YvcK family protein [Acidobacteriota bacterium]